MGLKLIPEGPLFWWENTWTTDNWRLLFAACFREMNLLDLNIFQRDQEVLT